MNQIRKTRRIYADQVTRKRKSAASFLTTGTLLAAQTICATSASAISGTFTVSKCDDMGSGTFRQALLDANDYASASRIVFSPTLGCTEIDPVAALDLVTVPIDIVGPGSDKLSINFTDTPGDPLIVSIPGGDVGISGLRIIGKGIVLHGGNPMTANINDVGFENIGANESWSAIYFYPGGSRESSGLMITNSTFGNSGIQSEWAIQSSFKIEIDNSTFVGNRFRLGLVNSSDKVSIRNSAFVDNNIPAVNSASAAINSTSTEPSVIDNSTFIGNVFQEGILATSGTISITNSTFASNTINDEGNTENAMFNAANGASTISLFGNIFAGNQSNNASNMCSGNPLLDKGANLYDGAYAGCSTNPLPSVVQSDGSSAVVSSLRSTLATTAAMNGGTTPTVALLPGSPAIDYYTNGDAGVSGTLPTRDQRRLSRPFGAGYDVGAVEYRPVVTAPTTPPASIENIVKPISLDSILFMPNSAKLTKAGKKKLDENLATIVKSGLRTVTISGHTAAPGKSTSTKTRYRNKLSKARALTVERYLRTAAKKQNLTLTFESQGLGVKNPVATNKKESGRKLNRRVDITIN